MLDAYFERIGYDGPVRIDLETLRGVQRAHLLAIPYENLEIQFGRGNVLDEAAFVDKLVTRRRGGWCYEMNGLLTLALREMGFDVRRVGGAVDRETSGDRANRNHMVGLVDLDRTYVTDVGLGDGPLDPFPLEENEWTEGPAGYSVENLGGGWWRFRNDPLSLAPSFDLTEAPLTLADYEPTSRRLQTDPASSFVGLAIVSRRTATGYETLRDTNHTVVDSGARSDTRIEDAEEWEATLRRLLGTDLGPEASTLWETVRTRTAERARARDYSSG
jgi:N-hydroxyarylamine O-acetyltransferase